MSQAGAGAPTGTITGVAVLSAAQVAQLVKEAGFPASVQATMVAISKAESGFKTDAIGGPNSNGTYDRGLFQINDVHKLDRNKLISDAKYNTAQAKKIYDSQGLRAWSTYTSGAYQKYMNEARQGVAQAASVVGSPAITTDSSSSGATSQPAITYGPPGPEITFAGVGSPLAAARVIPGPLSTLKVIGTDMWGDYSAVVIDNPKYTAGWDTVPNLQFTIADPQGDLLWQQRNVWVRGNRVTWEDLDMRLDEITFEPGGHTTGQISLSCIDGIVYALQQLRGARTASGISAVTWLSQELQLAGLDPNRCLLGEAVPTQSEISRDVPDEQTQSDDQDVPSAWTTITRLAKELGKRVFISSNKIVFGSAEFALRWCAPGDLLLAWHAVDDGQRWQTLPTAKATSLGSRSGTTEVTGRIPLERAKYFRPGVSVQVRQTPSVAAGDLRQFICSHIEYELGRDIDGADITLNEPIDPVAAPPGGNGTNTSVNSGSASSGSSTSGGGADGQIDQFVALCLKQVGDKYVFGAETRQSDPDPSKFDCSELVEWAAGRVGIKGVPDGSAAQINHCTRLTVAQAIKTKGALLYHPGHIAVSLGNGKTVEAANSRVGVIQGTAGSRFTRGGKIPGATGYR